jgi:PAS domain S-box-containing protein
MIYIKDIMTTKNVSVDSNTTLEVAINKMVQNLQGVVVILLDNIPIGILTERDIVNIVHCDIDIVTTTLKKYMTQGNLVTIHQNRGLEYALQVLIDNGIRRLIIIDNDGNFSGIVTQDTLIKHLEEDAFNTNILVSSLVTNKKRIITIKPNDTLLYAFNIMNENNIGSVVILDDSSKPMGILTERDCITITNKHINMHELVQDYMTAPVIWIYDDEKVKDVVELMDKKHIRHILVVDKYSKEPISMLSIRDIANNLKGKYGKLLESKLQNIKKAMNYVGEAILEIYNDNGNFIIQWVNDVAKTYFGNIQDNELVKLIPEGTWSDICIDLNNAIEKKYKVQIKDQYFELSCSYHSLKNKNTILLLLNDITEFEYKVKDLNKKNEELKKELDILKSVIDQQNSIVIVTNTSDILLANKSFFEFFQVDSIKEFKQTYISIENTFITHKSFFSTKDSTTDTNWIQNILKLKTKDRIVSIVHVKTVEPKAFTVQISELGSKDGNYVVTLTDITEFEKFQTYLESSNKLLSEYKKAVDASAIVSKSDKKGVITYANDKFAEISRYSKDELIGKPHSILRDPDVPKSVFKEMWDTIQNKQIWQGQIKNRRKDGSNYYVDATIVPILSNNNEILEYLALS